MNIEIKRITEENKDAVKLKNYPFKNTGRVVAGFDGTEWSYELEPYPEAEQTDDCFPDMHYEYEKLGDDFRGFAAYVDGELAGYALYFESCFKYLYLDDLSVAAPYRRGGVGTALIEAGMKLAEAEGKLGIRLVCQDNNMAAFEFYIKNGFKLGGADSYIYEGTKQEGKTDLYLYRRA